MCDLKGLRWRQDNPVRWEVKMLQWKKVRAVARHEYLVNIRRPGFIIMTAIVPILAIIGLLLGGVGGNLFGGQAFRQIGAFLEDYFEGSSKHFGVVDHSGYFTSILPEFQEGFISYPGEEEAKEALMREEIDAVLVIPEDYISTGNVTVITKGSGFGAAALEDSTRVKAFFISHLVGENVASDLRKRAADPINAQPVVLTREGKTRGGGPLGVIFTFVIPYAMAFLLVMTIFISSGYLLQSVAEEKESRVVEIVISSITPMELMAGKVMGLGALGLTQVLIWLLTTWGISGGAMALFALTGAFAMPVRVLALVVVYFVLGFTLYAILMAGVGSLGTTMRESQQLAGIFSMFAAVPYMLSGFLFANPNMLVARILSFFPLTAPTMMMMRLPLAEVPWVDILGSTGVLVVSIPVALWIGAKLFRVGLLIYGKRPTWKEIFLILKGP